MKKYNLVVFNDENLELEVKVDKDNETVWLNLEEIAILFDRDKSVISRHIKNILTEELEKEEVIAKFATTTKHGAIEGKSQTHIVDYYNLDMIISVGYRVKSKRGIAFRKWANSVLKKYLLEGYVVNNKRLEQLEKSFNLISIASRLDSKIINDEGNAILQTLLQYNKALSVLDDYDHQCLKRPKGLKDTYRITYEECRSIIDSMNFNSDLFGKERDGSFNSSINTIYQSMFGKDLYETREEKAANLLYFITKNHSFYDGNKRIAASIFIFFLHKNNMLYKNNEKVIDDATLVAMTILIAESKPEEKEVIISLLMSFFDMKEDVV